jgi:hypothetical protein
MSEGKVKGKGADMMDLIIAIIEIIVGHGHHWP